MCSRQTAAVSARRAPSKKLWELSPRRETTRAFDSWKPSCYPNGNKHGQTATPQPDVRVSCVQKPRELRGSAVGRLGARQLFEVGYRTRCTAAASSKYSTKRKVLCKRFGMDLGFFGWFVLGFFVRFFMVNHLCCACDFR